MENNIIKSKDLNCCCKVSLAHAGNELLLSTTNENDIPTTKKIQINLPGTHNGFISGEPKVLALHGQFAISKLPIKDTLRSILSENEAATDEYRLAVIDTKKEKSTDCISTGYIPNSAEIEVFNFDISNDGSFMAIACGILHDKSSRNCKYHAFVKMVDSDNGDTIYEQACNMILPPAILFCQKTNDFFTLYCDEGSEQPVLRQFNFESVNQQLVPDKIKHCSQHKVCFRIKLQNKVKIDVINVEDEVYTNIHISKDRRFCVLQILEPMYPNNEFLCTHFVFDAKTFRRLKTISTDISQPCNVNCVTCGHMTFRPQDSICGSKFMVASFESTKPLLNQENCKQNYIRRFETFDYPVVMNLQHRARVAVLMNVSEKEVHRLPIPASLQNYLQFDETLEAT